MHFVVFKLLKHLMFFSSTFCVFYLMMEEKVEEMYARDDWQKDDF